MDLSISLRYLKELSWIFKPEGKKNHFLKKSWEDLVIVSQTGGDLVREEFAVSQQDQFPSAFSEL
jgi:hypothetical protein